MAHSPEAAVYRASLPVAGISGTLQNRFRNTPAKVFSKLRLVP
jgi:D-alanyl-D-alanine carboxypeptidase/D-alanyl-D-alanine-endopeptidase (penicillin-binding protein 4)